MADVVSKLRGLVLSANELAALTDWDSAVIEDYLELQRNILTLAESIEGGESGFKSTARVTFADSPYEIPDDVEEIFFDTTDGDIVANLMAGEEGKSYRLINTGFSGNKAFINPFGTELLKGENDDEYVGDGEVLILTYEETEGWW